jgi:uncharacterized protein YqgC (DUF456 family)
MTEHVKRFGKMIAGGVLILAGLVGLVLPVLPGLLLIYLGLELLGFGLVLRELVIKYRKKYWKE